MQLTKEPLAPISLDNLQTDASLTKYQPMLTAKLEKFSKRALMFKKIFVSLSIFSGLFLASAAGSFLPSSSPSYWVATNEVKTEITVTETVQTSPTRLNANAGANDAVEFDAAAKALFKIINGPLAKALALMMFLMGGALAIAKNNPMPAISGIAFASFISFGPTVVEGILSPTLTPVSAPTVVSQSQKTIAFTIDEPSYTCAMGSNRTQCGIDFEIKRQAIQKYFSTHKNENAMYLVMGAKSVSEFNERFKQINTFDGPAVSLEKIEKLKQIETHRVNSQKLHQAWSMYGLALAALFLVGAIRSRQEMRKYQLPGLSLSKS